MTFLVRLRNLLQVIHDSMATKKVAEKKVVATKAEVVAPKKEVGAVLTKKERMAAAKGFAK